MKKNAKHILNEKQDAEKWKKGKSPFVLLKNIKENKYIYAQRNSGKLLKKTS